MILNELLLSESGLRYVCSIMIVWRIYLWKQNHANSETVITLTNKAGGVNTAISLTLWLLTGNCITIKAPEGQSEVKRSHIEVPHTEHRWNLTCPSQICHNNQRGHSPAGFHAGPSVGYSSMMPLVANHSDYTSCHNSALCSWLIQSLGPCSPLCSLFLHVLLSEAVPLSGIYWCWD